MSSDSRHEIEEGEDNLFARVRLNTDWDEGGKRIASKMCV
jgi:hypothetical protein